MKRILLAILALPAMAARRLVNLLPVLALVGFAAFLTACGGSSGGNSAVTPSPTMTVMMPDPTPPAPITLDITSPDLSAWHVEAENGSYWFYVFPLSVDQTPTLVLGRPITPFRREVSHLRDVLERLPKSDRDAFFSGGNDAVFENGERVYLAPGTGQVFFATRPTITALVQLCPARWLATHINNFIPGNICPPVSPLSYSPDMRRVIYSAMADGFNRGIGIAESAFSFSGRYEGNNRTAGFAYDFDNFALRADYIRLPSKQDGDIWLDTYRFGILRPINDEARFFVGVDSYRNAIFAIDAQGNKSHRLGFVVGKGYAVKYEFRVGLNNLFGRWK